MRLPTTYSLLPVLFPLVIYLSPGIAYTQLPNAQDELQIRDRLALYAYAVDDKKFDLLDQVFTADVKAVYSDAESDKFDNVCRGFLFVHTLCEIHVFVQA